MPRNNVISTILTQLTTSDDHREAESPGSRLVENLPHIVFQLDTEYRWALLNKSWELVTGFPRKESIGLAYQDFIHPEDRDHLHDYLQSLQRRRKKTDAIEARLLTRDGKSRWTEVSAMQITDANGLPVRVGTIIDITERIAEEELLHAKHRSLSGLLNDLSGMVYRCRNDKLWTMEYLSGGCKDLTGYAPSDMINNSKLSWDSLIHPEDHDMVWAEVQSGVREARYFEMVYRMYTIDKKQKWVWERGKGIFSDDGELLGLEGYIIDITANKLRRDTLQNEQLYDPDTDLPHLPLFRDRLVRAIARFETAPDECFSLLMIQYHRLLDVFERYGETFENETTLAITAGLKGVVDKRDSITCIKPDRYAVLIERAHTPDCVRTLAQRLLEVARAPIQIDGKTHFLTCSIGGADGSYGNNTVDSVMRNALVAMDHAGAQGGSRFEVYDPDTVDY